MSKPAAKQGDKIVATDIHIIMVPSPGGPVPTPTPTPFNGTITTNLSTDVFIEGKPAATVNSEAMNTPPHIPAGGPFQKPPTNQGKIQTGSPFVLINGKPAARATDTALTCNDPADLPIGQVVATSTVFIGGPSFIPSAGAAPSEEATETKPKALVNAHWEKSVICAVCQKSVKLLVDTRGFEDGEPVRFEVYKRTANGDTLITNVQGSVSKGKAEAEWNVEHQYSPIPEGEVTPRYLFVARAGEEETGSQLLTIGHDIEIELVDEDGKPLADVEYTIDFIEEHGESRSGKTSSDGKLIEKNAPPGQFYLTLKETGYIEFMFYKDESSESLKGADYRLEQGGMGEKLGKTDDEEKIRVEYLHSRRNVVKLEIRPEEEPSS